MRNKNKKTDTDTDIFYATRGNADNPCDKSIEIKTSQCLQFELRSIFDFVRGVLKNGNVRLSCIIVPQKCLCKLDVVPSTCYMQGCESLGLRSPFFVQTSTIEKKKNVIHAIDIFVEIGSSVKDRPATSIATYVLIHIISVVIQFFLK